jgi:hypothetical protein
MRDSNAAGTLRATERLRHPHDHKPRAPASPTRAALAKGASTLGTVLATGAGTLALGLTAVKLGSAVAGLYGRHRIKRASEASLRELRVIVVTPKTQVATCAPLTNEQRKAFDDGKHMGNVTKNADGTLATSIGRVWKPEQGKIMVCVRGKCTIIDSAEAVAWVNEFAGRDVKTFTYKLGMSGWNPQTSTNQAVRPVCAAMARALAEARRDTQLDSTNLTAKALSDENGTWLEAHATCEFISGKFKILRCNLKRGNELDVQLIPFESLLTTIDTARVSAAFGHGLWHKMRDLPLPAHSVVMYTE